MSTESKMDDPCNECIKGTIHTGSPIGNLTTLHGLPVYQTGNLSSPHTIIIYSDIFSHNLPNNFLLADAYAYDSSGVSKYRVLFPDFFNGDAVPLKTADVFLPVDAEAMGAWRKYTGILACAPGFLRWKGRHGGEGCERICSAFLRGVRSEMGAEGKIGMVGFCWGGRYAVRAGLERNMYQVDGIKKPLVDAVVAMHPSHLTLPGDVEGLVVPVSFGWGETDIAVNFKQKGLIEDVHAKESEGGRKLPEMEHRVYRPGRHGFAVRGNPDDPAERKCLEDSMKQGREWLERWL